MNWEEIDGKLTKVYSFQTFGEAVEFVNEVARIADQLGHYPDILLFGYNQVKVTTFTTEEQDLTNLDYDLIEAIDGPDELE